MTFDSDDIISGRRPGGSMISQSMQLQGLTDLLAAVKPGADPGRYHTVAVEQNLLGKATHEGRRRAFRVLRELYLLDSRRLLFRALRDLWDEDTGSRPLLAGLCAYARDSSFRASGTAVLPERAGVAIAPSQLASAVTKAFPGNYSAATAAKIARNTGASWSQTGHLTVGGRKSRRQVRPSAVAVAYAMLLGHLQGSRGEGLLSSPWTQFLDMSVEQARDLATAASAHGYLEYRAAGNVIDVTFRHLLREEPNVEQH